MVELNKGKIFYIPEFSKKHKYLLLYVGMCLMRRLLPFIIDSFEFGTIKTPDFNKSCCFDMVNNFTADFLTGLYVLVKFIRKKREKKKERETLIDKEHKLNDSLSSQKERELAFHKVQEANQMRKRFIIIMLIISISDIIAQLCLLIFSYIDKKGSTLNFDNSSNDKLQINEDDLIFTVALNIIFRYIFSRLLLTIYIYYHHLISIIITIISFIPLVIFNMITLRQKKGESDLIIYVILNIAMTIIYAFEDVMNKIAFNKLVVRPPELMFYKAVYQIPMFIIIFFCVFLKDTISPIEGIMSFSDYLSGNSEKLFGRIIYRFSFIIANIFRTLSLQLVTEILSPNHLSILKSFEFVVLTIYTLIKDLIIKSLKSKNNTENNTENNTGFYILELICCIFLLFASLIYNEFFVINRCNLMKSTDYCKSLKDEKVDDEIKEFELMKKKMDEQKKSENENEGENEKSVLLPNLTNSFENDSVKNDH